MLLIRFSLLVVMTCVAFSLFSEPKKENRSPEVDIVYTWVDSSDPMWQREREYYVAEQLGLSGDGNSAQRFRSRDELKYSLRSIRAFAPYVRKIFIVTNGQRPRWIKPHPKICFISHAQIFRDLTHLPTFNSMAIESCLHRIPGLSDHFIYFNDDVFLGKPTTFDTFFTKNGKIKVFLTDRLIERAPEAFHKNKVGYQIAIHNTDAFLSTHFSKAPRYHLAHVPDASRKSLSQSFEIQFYNLFFSVEGHRFRCKEDYALTNGFIPYAAYYYGNADLVKEVSCRNLRLYGDPEHDIATMRRTLKQQPRFFCVQDCQEGENPRTDRALKKFFESYFPEPAPWEEE